MQPSDTIPPPDDLPTWAAGSAEADATVAPPGGDSTVAPPGDMSSTIAPPPASRPAQGNDRLGGYVLERELARGGMGAVYVAHDERLGRQVAIKVLLAEREAGDSERQRFQIEAEAIARLRHPSIVAVHETGVEAGRAYLVMDLVEGESLAAKLEREGSLSSEATARLGVALADALHHAHGHSILHRDMKPANVLMNQAGVPLITDFGLAKDLSSSSGGLTKTGQMMGTPKYMPPEQVSADKEQMGPATDVYSLGATLFHLVTGRPPFDGGTALNVITAVLREDPPRPSDLKPGVPVDLDAVLLKCLAKEPGRRYPTADALKTDLERFLAGDSVLGKPPPRGFARLVRRHPILALCAAASLLLLFGVGLYKVEQARREAVVLAKPTIRFVDPAPGTVSFDREITLVAELSGPEAVNVRLGSGGGRWTEGVPTAEPLVTPVKLQPGPNQLVLAVEDEHRQRATAKVLVHYWEATPESGPVPGWFREVEARPPFPLPKSLRFGERPNEYINKKDGSVLCWVPGGSFVMGRDAPQPPCDPGFPVSPSHEVTVRGFFMGKHEVSWAQYDRFLRGTRRKVEFAERSSQQRGIVRNANDGDPAFNLSRVEAIAYCRWAGGELRLPTEAEWEYAAGGGKGLTYPWGNEDQADRRNVWDENEPPPFWAAVDSFPTGASPYGCLHMAGNVAEWLDGEFATYPGGPELHPDRKGQKPIRGGSWNLPAWGNYRVFDRRSHSEHHTDIRLGFRVSRSYP